MFLGHTSFDINEIILHLIVIISSIRFGPFLGGVEGRFIAASEVALEIDFVLGYQELLHGHIHGVYLHFGVYIDSCEVFEDIIMILFDLLRFEFIFLG